MTTDDGGMTRVSPDQLREFGSTVGNVNQAIAEVHGALDSLGNESMATGSGQDNEAIVQYYRTLIGEEAASAAGRTAGQLEQIRDAAHANADDWENQERASTEGFQG